MKKYPMDKIRTTSYRNGYIREAIKENEITEVVRSDVPMLTFPALGELSDFVHGFATRKGGVSEGIYTSMNLSYTRGDDPECVDDNFAIFMDALDTTPDMLVCTDQTHTANIRHVRYDDAGKGVRIPKDYTDVDALITDDPGLVLGIFFADCVPIFFADPVRKCIGAAHSGWKGTVQMIGKKTVEAMAETFGSDPKDIIAGIGPSICVDCYEVSEDVVDRFREIFTEEELELVCYEKDGGKYQLDLWRANELILEKAGILPEHISTTDICTCCNPDVLFSHRASHGLRGNGGGFIYIKDEESFDYDDTEIEYLYESDEYLSEGDEEYEIEEDTVLIESKLTENIKGHLIADVEEGSIAEELEVEPGDRLLVVNGKTMEDIFDYQYLTKEEFLTIVIRKPDGEEWELEIEKDLDEDLGIVFENGLMDDYRSCRNKCIFCFIDQMPEGMRDTLYFKDDDSRLSFLQGNYITLTNMSDADVDRIIKYHLSPINISFQTMNPELRCKMLHNRFAGEALKKVDRLYEAGAEMNGQIVLCKGVNDKEELRYSIEQMIRYLPHLKSVSIVPAGLTKYRDGLFPLELFTKEEAIEVIEEVEKWQRELYPKWGLHFVHCSDEWYLLAERPIPSADTYDGYLQLENGVGMIRLLMDEVEEDLAGRKGDDRVRIVDNATGLLAGPFIKMAAEKVRKQYPNLQVKVHEIRNEFFGETITVAGLITGQDLVNQLRGKLISKELLIPDVMLRDGEEVFLDDLTISEVEETLQIKVTVVKSGGRDLVNAFLGISEETAQKRYDAGYPAYELKEIDYE